MIHWLIFFHLDFQVVICITALVASSSAGVPLLGHGYGPAIVAPAYGPALGPAYGNLDATTQGSFIIKNIF